MSAITLSGPRVFSFVDCSGQKYMIEIKRQSHGGGAGAGGGLDMF